MGSDVYTPAYRRLQENAEYKALRAEYDAWDKRPTVQAQEWTEQDTLDFERLTKAIWDMERPTGYGSFRLPFNSWVKPVRLFQTDMTGHYSHFDMTHEQVGVLLTEFRRYLRDLVSEGWGEAMKIPKDYEGMANRYQADVVHYKTLCRVYKLGEGCYVT